MMGKTELDKRLADIPQWKRRWHSRLTDFSAAVLQEMVNQDVSIKQLAERTGRSESFFQRMFGGGVNLTMKTICEIEAALDVDLININVDTPDIPRRGSSQNLQ